MKCNYCQSYITSSTTNGDTYITTNAPCGCKYHLITKECLSYKPNLVNKSVYTMEQLEKEIKEDSKLTKLMVRYDFFNGVRKLCIYSKFGTFITEIPEIKDPMGHPEAIYILDKKSIQGLKQFLSEIIYLSEKESKNGK